MKVTLQHKPADRLYSFLCSTATMTRILTQKVPQIPLGACIVTSAVSLYTLTDKEPLLSSDSRHCGWIIYGGIPTLWLRKRHTPTEGREVVKGSVCVGVGLLHCLKVCTFKSVCLFGVYLYTQLSICTMGCMLNVFFFCFFYFLLSGFYMAHNATVHLTSERGSKCKGEWANMNWWIVRTIHFHYAELPSPKSFVNYPFKKCWTLICALINIGA